MFKDAKRVTFGIFSRWHFLRQSLRFEVLNSVLQRAVKRQKIHCEEHVKNSRKINPKNKSLINLALITESLPDQDEMASDVYVKNLSKKKI
jgi:spore maturation protein CgeB